MSSTTFPSDKEPGASLPIITEKRSRSESENPPPSTRQTIFVLSLLWASWLVGRIFDTVLEANTGNPLRMSPLQFYVYIHQWDVWVLRLDYFHLLHTAGQIKTIVTVCLALHAMLILAYVRSMPPYDIVTGSAISLLLALCVFAAARLGLSEREVGLIAMPFAWMVGTTAAIFLRRVGIDDLDQRFGAKGKVGQWCYLASMTLFMGVYTAIYGVGNGIVVLFVVFQGVRLVHGWLA